VLDCVGAECRGRYCRGGDSVSVGLGAAALVFALVQGLHSSGVHYPVDPYKLQSLVRMPFLFCLFGFPLLLLVHILCARE
jgi:hypothetical protein